MDVASVISQYALEGEIEMGFEWEDANTQTFGGRTMYTDRPTISYAPLMGENYARSLLKPIPNSAILLLVEAGYPIDYVLRTCVQTINGLDNRMSGRFTSRDADPEFYELLILLRHIQANEGMIMRSKTVDGKKTLSVIFRRPDRGFSTELQKTIQLLNLDPDAKEFRVVSGSYATNSKEIAIFSRSMLQVFSAYASHIDVPESDISDGRVAGAAPQDVENQARFSPLIQVHNGASKPEDAFVVVPYHEHWFWIDDRDIHSKSTFFFLMILFSFTERAVSGQAAPILTVPTN
jgi:hypothetical protein